MPKVICGVRACLTAIQYKLLLQIVCNTSLSSRQLYVSCSNVLFILIIDCYMLIEDVVFD